MSTTYATIGTALYNLFDGIDISAIYSSGWALKANYPLKEPGLTTTFPVFSVFPAQDNENSIDSIGTDATVTYYVYLYDSFQDPTTSEPKLRQLVDLCRTTLRQQYRSNAPLGDAAYTLGQLVGEWGFDSELGLRYYRFTIEAKMYEVTV